MTEHAAGPLAGLPFERQGSGGSATGAVTGSTATTAAHEMAHAIGPSFWPAWFAAASFVVFAGLSLAQPVLVIGGLVLLAAATIGWGVEAGAEWRAKATAETRVSKPSTVGWGRAFAGFFLAVLAASTLGSLVVATEPSRATAAGQQPGSAEVVNGEVAVRAAGIAFSVTEIAAPANTAFTIHFTNDDAVPHNIAILGTDGQTPLFSGELITGPARTASYAVPALAPGTYRFHCVVHPTTMTGTVIVR